MIHIRVGAFDVYPTERRLMLGDRPIELGGRAFDLLLVLVEQPGRLVHKNTLMQRVWPKLVVDENNLAAQVASLRRALGQGQSVPCPDMGMDWNCRWSWSMTRVARRRRERRRLKARALRRLAVRYRASSRLS